MTQFLKFDMVHWGRGPSQAGGGGEREGWGREGNKGWGRGDIYRERDGEDRSWEGRDDAGDVEVDVEQRGDDGETGRYGRWEETDLSKHIVTCIQCHQ